MYKKERLDQIMSLLKENTFVPVKFLCKTLHYSNATINRDLNYLEGQNLVKRTYGGVEINQNKGIPLLLRYDFMKKEKRKIGKEAATFVNDGETIFIDGSTTAEYMIEHLIDKHDLTIVTSNLAVATFLSQHKITVYTLGGKITEPPYIVLSDETIFSANKYHYDKMFFSTGNVTSDGKIDCGNIQYFLYSTVAENSDKIFYLCGHEKIDYRLTKPAAYLFNFSKVDFVISDFDFSKETKDKFSNTEFILV